MLLLGTTDSVICKGESDPYSLVGDVGFEPTTLRSQSECATRLRQSPLTV